MSKNVSILSALVVAVFLLGCSRPELVLTTDPVMGKKYYELTGIPLTAELNQTYGELKFKDSGPNSPIRATLIITETDGRAYKLSTENKIRLRINGQNYPLDIINFSQKAGEIGKSIILKDFHTTRVFTFRLTHDIFYKMLESDEIVFEAPMILTEVETSLEKNAVFLKLDKSKAELMKKFYENTHTPQSKRIQ
jgi:hypothetical protein